MPASEKRLGDLHEKVTEALINKMDGTRYDRYDEEGNPTGEYDVTPPSAAEIMAAAKFLSDNKITCAPAKDNLMGKLEEAAAERRQKRLSRREMSDAARDAARELYGDLN